MVEAFAARRFLDIGEARRTVLQHHPGLQPLDHLVVDLAAHTYRVFPVHFVRGVHQTIGQLTVSGEQQQPRRVDIEPAYIDPAALLGTWQAIEHRRAAFGVVAGADLAVGLVVDQHTPHHLAGFFALEQAAIDRDGVMGIDTLAECGNRAIDLDAALDDPLFDVATRRDAQTGKDFLQLLAVRGVDRSFFVLGHLGTSRCGNPIERARIIRGSCRLRTLRQSDGGASPT